jgi:hypothetical protein
MQHRDYTDPLPTGVMLILISKLQNGAGKSNKFSKNPVSVIVISYSSNAYKPIR